MIQKTATLSSSYLRSKIWKGQRWVFDELRWNQERLQGSCFHREWLKKQLVPVWMEVRAAPYPALPPTLSPGSCRDSLHASPGPSGEPQVQLQIRNGPLLLWAGTGLYWSISSSLFPAFTGKEAELQQREVASSPGSSFRVLKSLKAF